MTAVTVSHTPVAALRRFPPSEPTRSSRDRAIEMLRSNPTFASSEGSALELLAERAEVLTLPARTPVHGEGDEVRYLYVVVEGAVRVFHGDGQGRQVTVRHLAPPSTFGEVDIVTGSEILESVECLTDATLVRIPEAAYRRYLATDGNACRELLHDVAARFVVAARNEHAVFFEVEQRLASLLLAYADFFGKPVAGGLRINLKLTQEDFANGLGVVVRSVSRALTVWKKRGWIALRKGWYVIYDQDSLLQTSRGLQFNLNYRCIVDERASA